VLILYYFGIYLSRGVEYEFGNERAKRTEKNRLTKGSANGDDEILFEDFNSKDKEGQRGADAPVKNK